jgi:hypothetical protein
MIEQVKGLSVYLQEEHKIADATTAQWGQELELFSKLADSYIRLNTLAKIKDIESDIPVNLFLTVQSQMFGVVSQILRRRIADAEAGTRRAIEVTATAYRLTIHPELLEVYVNAYHDKSGGVRDDWQPSEEYKYNFSIKKLFSEPEEFWKTLRIDYAMFSVMATHAGLGATASHLTLKDQRVLPFFESDDKNVYRCWYHQVAIYGEVLKVFLRVLRRTVDPPMIRIFEDEMIYWKNHAFAQLKKRAPWIEETMKARETEKNSGSLSSLIIIPNK